MGNYAYLKKIKANGNLPVAIILLNIMSLDIDIIYTNDIFRLQSSDTTVGALLYLA